MATGKQYADEAIKVYNRKPKAGYIYGTMNKLWTAQDQAALERKYKSDPVKYSNYKLGAEKGSKWIGHTVFDCSGLTKYCGAKLGLNYAHGSNSSYRNDCQYKGAKTRDMKLPVGAWVYTGTAANRGHIGIVVDDEYVVEAQGTNAGVVKSKISLSKWTWWGLGKGLSFDFIPGQNGSVKPCIPMNTEPKDEAIYVKATMPTLRKGSRGNEVITLQKILKKDESSLAVDGIFGTGTLNAVLAFQRRHGLVADGIVGPKTWNELRKIA